MGVSKMAKAVYIDTSKTPIRIAMNSGRRQKLHCVFDGERIFKINRLTKLKMLMKYSLIHCFQRFTMRY
jgi:hypothetical protein